MPLRLVQVSVPRDAASSVVEALRIDPAVGSWPHPLDDDRTLVSLLVDAKQCEGILDRLGQRFSAEAYRALILSVEATLPKPPPEPPVNEPKPDRIARDELLQDLAEGLDPGARFFIMVLLSSIVAAIGLLRNDLAIIIGAMVIAPLLTPNMALALVICLNLSAVVTFWAKGVRPRTWWEAEKAGRAMRIAVLLWGILLATLVALIAIGAS